jgi:hypothetical protein
VGPTQPPVRRVKMTPWRLKRLERETDHSASSAEGQEWWNHTFTSLYVFHDVMLNSGEGKVMLLYVCAYM